MELIFDSWQMITHKLDQTYLMISAEMQQEQLK